MWAGSSLFVTGHENLEKRPPSRKTPVLATFGSVPSFQSLAIKQLHIYPFQNNQPTTHVGAGGGWEKMILELPSKACSLLTLAGG